MVRMAVVCLVLVAVLYGTVSVVLVSAVLALQREQCELNALRTGQPHEWGLLHGCRALPRRSAWAAWT